MTMTRAVRTDVGSSPLHNTPYPYFAGFTQADLHREERVCVTLQSTWILVEANLEMAAVKKKVRTIYDGQETIDGNGICPGGTEKTH